MQTDTDLITTFDPAVADPQTIESFYRFSSAIRLEREPDDPSPSLEAMVAELRGYPPTIAVSRWIARHGAGGEIIGHAPAGILHMPENEHLVQFDISVSATFRRRRLGTRLLREVANLAERNGRRLLVTHTHSAIPTGEAFMRAIGATVGLRQTVRELDLRAVDRGLLTAWQGRANERAGAFELEFWEGPYPDDQLDVVAAMYEAHNMVPLGDLDVGHFSFRADQIREMDEAMVKRGEQRWTLRAVDPTSNTIAGYTELLWHAEQPEHGKQGITAVFPAYRNLGLGRWLKAEMIEKALRERPGMTRISTENATSNAAMLAINEELGFREKVSTAYWQVDLEGVVKYLRQRGLR